METYLVYSILALVFLVAGYFLGNYIQNLKTKSSNSTLLEREQQLRNNLSEMEKRLELGIEETRELRSQKELLGIQISRYETEMANLQQKNTEQKGEVEKLQEKFTKEFENLANRILDVKSEKFTKQNKENIENILNPLKEKIKTFEDKVEKSQKENISIHSSLKEQLLNLQSQNLK
ncbi:MAG: DNA recombination protein RmuC, partial [Eudoraea sp.]